MSQKNHDTDRALQRDARRRAKETGEKYTAALRAVKAERARWSMLLCPGYNALDEEMVEETFNSWPEVLAWLGEHHPDLLDEKTWRSLENERVRQFGTGYYWAELVREP